MSIIVSAVQVVTVNDCRERSYGSPVKRDHLHAVSRSLLTVGFPDRCWQIGNTPTNHSTLKWWWSVMLGCHVDQSIVL